VGQDVAIESEAERLRPEASEVQRLIADASLAQSLLGWRPRFSLEDGLQLTIEWFRDHLAKYRPGVYAR
jgi:dTDP-glucose 4,6-dehydratase